MKKLMALIVLLVFVFSGCTKTDDSNSVSREISSVSEATESISEPDSGTYPIHEYCNPNFQCTEKTDLSLIPQGKIKLWLDFGESEARLLYDAFGIDNIPIKITDVYITEIDGVEIALVTYSNIATPEDKENNTVIYDTVPAGNKFMGYSTYMLFVNDKPYLTVYDNHLFSLDKNVSKWIIGKDITESPTFFVNNEDDLLYGKYEISKDYLWTAGLWFYDEEGIPRIYNVYDPVLFGDSNFMWETHISWDISTGTAFDDDINVLSVNQIPNGASSTLAFNTVYKIDAENNTLVNVTNEWHEWKYGK